MNAVTCRSYRGSEMFFRARLRAVEELQIANGNALYSGGAGVGGHDVHFIFLVLSQRAAMLRTNTVAVMRSAPVHASRCQSA